MAENDFSLGDALQIAHQCTIDVTGKDHAPEPSATLSNYGIKTGEQISLLKKDIRTNNAIGLPAYGRTINPNAFNEMTTAWTISKLSDVIFDFSTPVVEESVKFAARSAAARGAEASQASEPQKEFTRANMMQATMIAGAMGMLIGIFLGRRGR